MKRFLFLTLLCTLLAESSLYAQGRFSYDYDITYSPHEFYLQYGAPSFQELSTQISKSPFSVGNRKFLPNDFSYTGIAAIGYNYYTSALVAIGAYFGISQATMHLRDERSKLALYECDVRSYTGMLTGSWVYLRSGLWELSAQASLGLSRCSTQAPDLETNQWRFAYHLSPLHVRWGGTLGVFADLGWGYRGVANAGISIKF